MISGPFFIGGLVGVGCRVMVLGPCLGTLAGTLDPTPMCAYQAHIVLRRMAVKYFDKDDAKNAKFRTERGIGFEDILFHIERGDLLDILEHPNPERYGGSAFSWSDERSTCIWCRSSRISTRSSRRRSSRVGRPRRSASVRSPMKIDADKKELLESVERGDWKSAAGGKRERTRYTRYAKATFRKDRRLNIRLSGKDLEAIQKRALAEGLPYQTLIASLLHKYATGRLKEI